MYAQFLFWLGHMQIYVSWLVLFFSSRDNVWYSQYVRPEVVLATGMQWQISDYSCELICAGVAEQATDGLGGPWDCYLQAPNVLSFSKIMYCINFSAKAKLRDMASFVMKTIYNWASNTTECLIKNITSEPLIRCVSLICWHMKIYHAKFPCFFWNLIAYEFLPTATHEQSVMFWLAKLKSVRVAIWRARTDVCGLLFLFIRLGLRAGVDDICCLWISEYGYSYCLFGWMDGQAIFRFG